MATDEKIEQNDNDSVKEISDDKEELSKANKFEATNENKNKENPSKANNEKNNTKDDAKSIVIREDEEDIELL